MVYNPRNGSQRVHNVNWLWLRLDAKLERDPKHFVLQTGLAFISTAIILTQTGFLGRGVLVAALGSSIFVAFLTPAAYTARSRNIIGSHVLSGAIGIGFYHLIVLFPNKYPLFILLSAASVSLSMFVMVVTDTEHPRLRVPLLVFPLREVGCHFYLFRSA